MRDREMGKRKKNRRERRKMGRMRKGRRPRRMNDREGDK